MTAQSPVPDTDVAIRVSGVSKEYRLRGAGKRTLKSAFLDAVMLRKSRRFRALSDVSFTVGRGETLGIIGSNGAGKSTLLGILAGTKAPTSGTVNVRGTVCSMLELGAGFHPDLTGRENVFLYGAVIGLSRRQMQDRFDAIVDFAEIRDFIDQPVRHYSSGMYVRLGFAVAVEVDPDVLLIDEVLAVGDAAFQRKCFGRIRAFRKSGKTMLIISHDLNAIRSISDRILLLDGGTVRSFGEPGAVVDTYLSMVNSQSEPSLRREWGERTAVMEHVAIHNVAGGESSVFREGESMVVRIRYRAKARIEAPVFGFGISDSEGRLLSGTNTQVEKAEVPPLEGEGVVDAVIGPLNLAGGRYHLSLALHSADHLTHYHRVDNGWSFSMAPSPGFEGVHIPCRWTFRK
jgi:ABC-type polysaccharide/polyol phosphate transport system ATPase subunit